MAAGEMLVSGTFTPKYVLRAGWNLCGFAGAQMLPSLFAVVPERHQTAQRGQNHSARKERSDCSRRIQCIGQLDLDPATPPSAPRRMTWSQMVRVTARRVLLNGVKRTIETPRRSALPPSAAPYVASSALRRWPLHRRHEIIRLQVLGERRFDGGRIQLHVLVRGHGEAVQRLALQ